MAIPLIVLAIGSIAAGFFGVPAALGGSNRIEHFLAESFRAPGAAEAAEHVEEAVAGHGAELGLMALASTLAIAGIVLAAFLYLRRPAIPRQLAARYPGVYRFLVNKGFIDELYDEAIVQPVKSLSENVLWRADAGLIDGAVNGVGTLVAESGELIRHVQTGSMRTYALSVLLGAVLLVGYYIWR
jgi:NADH-quinone oxidoreductase subunit L